MNIKMVSDVSLDGDLEKNIDTIIKNIETTDKGVLVLFSEAFLHGFNGLTWDYQKDIKIATKQDSHHIEKIKKKCKEKGVFCGFGYFEKACENIYCSYMIINDQGEIINNYRRISIGWKEYTITTKEYKEGTMLMPFKIKDFKAVTIICGDLWDDEIKNKLICIIETEKLDFVIWPNHLDYKDDEWDEVMSNDYAPRTKGIEVPIFLINDISKTSPGGAVVFQDGKILKKSKIRIPDILSLKI